jgi:hypothetical protein
MKLLSSIIYNITTMWMHERECEQWIEFLWTTYNLLRIFLPHKPNILHVNMNIPSTWKIYIDVARIFF